MRVNEPITNREIELPDHELLVSRTDTAGRIVFVNAAFTAISGYSEQELIGAPHNLIRHPHMPPEAFADLWATIKSGRPWEGFVKNRAKSGDFYWVRANVTPVTEDGRITGYISIRFKPTRQQIAAVEQVYARFRAGTAGGLRIEDGGAVATGPAARLGKLASAIGGRLAAMFGVMAAGLILVAGLAAAGLGGAVLAGTALAVIVAGGMLGLAVSRSIGRPLERMQAHFDAIARADFTHDIAAEAAPEFHRLTILLRAVKAKLTYATLEREENRRKAEAHLKSEMLKLTVMLETEVDTSVTEISHQARRLMDGASRLSTTADGLRGMAQSMSSAIETTSGNVQTVAGATEQLEASSREISARIQRSSEVTDAARHKVDAASSSVGSLTEATARIGDVVALIQTIAGQTRMLALNATIEAARAGETGKGFAVVAGEVKGLAGQTEDAIGRVNAQAQDIGRTTRDAVATVEAVAESIRDIDTIADEVAAAADEQRAATAEIMASAVQAADHTRDVADSAIAVLEGAEATGATARTVSELSSMVNRDIGALQRRLNVILRTSYGGNRRGAERAPVALKITASLGGRTFQGHTGDISPLGALLVVGDAANLDGAAGTIELAGVGTVEARVIPGGAHGIEVQFLALGPERVKALAEAIEQAKARDLPFIETAQAIAAKVTAAFEQALRDKSISMDDLFDTDYVPIADTDPMQVMARHTALTDRLLPPIVEPMLATNSNVVLCCATDRNGYIATHNQACSLPQRPGDPVWNAAHSRNRRVFDDRTGILAARNTQPYLAQTYARDMGGGVFVMMKEIDAPVIVAGRHWGAVRTALKL